MASKESSVERKIIFLRKEDIDAMKVKSLAEQQTAKKVGKATRTRRDVYH